MHSCIDKLITNYIVIISFENMEAFEKFLEPLPTSILDKRAMPQLVTKICDNRYDEVCG